jgi:DNA modification methylase
MKNYHKNPRRITANQVDDLRDSLADLGDLSGIIHDLNSDEIIGGNQRSHVFNVNHCEIELTHQAEEPDEQGTVAHGFVVWKGKRYAYRQVRWSERQCEQANIQANKLGGSWDWDILADQFDFDDLTAWGFSEDELLGLDFGEPEETDEGEDTDPQVNRADELQAEWGTELGQMWQLGPHRLICGDCTDSDVVGRLMSGAKAQATISDPPYGVSVGETNYNPKQKAKFDLIENDELRGNDFREFVKRFSTVCMAFTVAEGSFYFWSAPLLEGAEQLRGLIESGIHVQSQIIWVKPSLVLGQADYQWRHEICWYGFLKGEKHKWHGERNKTTVWEVGRENDGVHPTQKPVGLFERAAGNSTLAGDIILDPFCGSGTTIIAADNLSRVCYACEISPAYCAVILQRYLDHTGTRAELIEG